MLELESRARRPGVVCNVDDESAPPFHELPRQVAEYILVAYEGVDRDIVEREYGILRPGRKIPRTRVFQYPRHPREETLVRKPLPERHEVDLAVALPVSLPVIEHRNIVKISGEFPVFILSREPRRP